MSVFRRALVVAALLFVVPLSAEAAPVWVGDFETADLSQMSFVLNPMVGENTYAFTQTEEVAQGDHAARIELHNDAVWPNGLKRVELQHRPEDGRTADGQTTFFAWSVYLPDVLPEEPSQQIGYWESNDSFQQVMTFQVVGATLRFVTRRPQSQVQWEGENVLTAGQWHRIAMEIQWSTNARLGAVSLWFDGDQVVDGAPAQTLADGNTHFIQMGLLRGAEEFDDVPVILIDHALEGDSLEDVEYDALPDRGGEGTGSTSGGESSTGAASSSSSSGGEVTGGEAQTSTSGEGSTTGGTTSSSTGGDADTETDTDGNPGRGLPQGCRARGVGGLGPAWGLLALFGLRRSRRRRR